MAEERVQRRLAAVLAADVVGYSRMMELDESGTLERLQSSRQMYVLPQVEKHGGRVVKLMGDGALVEFTSVVAAVSCALEIQQIVAENDLNLPEEQRIRYRIGVNLGDLIVEGDDLYGEGVNMAARLQMLASPGSVAISQTVHDHVAGRLAVAFEDLGEHVVKAQERAIRVFGVSLGEASRAPKSRRLNVADVEADTRPTVCVLPFVNMSGDPEQEYFSDGITEDIIIDLSKVSALSVTARNTAFTFKGRAVDVVQVARQLRVSHVVEGSVRKAAGRVRVAAQLIDGARGNHVWAERYDRDLNDIFALQDEISTAIVDALKVKLLPTERQAIENRSTHNPEAYRLYLLSRHYLQHGIRHVEIALRICQRAVELDPNYARAWAMIAHCQAELHFGGRLEERGLSAAERALSLDPASSEAHAAKGRILAELGCFDEALALHRESLRLDPNSYDGHYGFGRTCLRLGRHEEAIEHFERAAELLETDYISPGFIAQSYAALGELEESISAARRALERAEREIALRPDNAHAVVSGAHALAYLGEFDRAKEWISRALIVTDPDDILDRYNLACASVKIGATDEALTLLESCVSDMPPEVVDWMKSDSDLAPLHRDPRFQALVEIEAKPEDAMANQAIKDA
ncbi:adenylate/guanylate cyclase domain-containing protein [Ensifer sp. IC3342]|nr:adenylate/guanylate cyclase domain-containing protein [Ensifer sp. BRP08]MCA1450790.1 adenylate/guanylate cyclase domain-containing protein [Ensifer sp. IC3342]